MTDLLTPIIGKNRDEILLIEYQGFLKNMAEELTLQMRLSRMVYDKILPGSTEYFDMDPFSLYNATAIFDREDMIHIMDAEHNLSDKDVNEILNSCNDVNVDYIRTDTMFEYAIRELAQMDFVKKIHIVKPGEFFDYEMDYLYEVVFKDIFYPKVSLYDGDILDFIPEEFHPTSIFINDADVMLKYFQRHPDKDNAFFYLRQNFSNMKLDETKNALISDETLDERMKAEGVKFVRMSIPHCEKLKISNPTG